MANSDMFVNYSSLDFLTDTTLTEAGYTDNTPEKQSDTEELGVIPEGDLKTPDLEKEGEGAKTGETEEEETQGASGDESDGFIDITDVIDSRQDLQDAIDSFIADSTDTGSISESPPAPATDFAVTSVDMPSLEETPQIDVI